MSLWNKWIFGSYYALLSESHYTNRNRGNLVPFYLFPSFLCHTFNFLSCDSFPFQYCVHASFVRSFFSQHDFNVNCLFHLGVQATIGSLIFFSVQVVPSDLAWPHHCLIYSSSLCQRPFGKHVLYKLILIFRETFFFSINMFLISLYRLTNYDFCVYFYFFFRHTMTFLLIFPQVPCS